MMKLVSSDDEYSVFLRCECKNFIIISKDRFKELNDNYVIPRDDAELICDKCGKAHADSVIILEEQHPAQSQINIPKCPTCGSQNIEQITRTNKAISFAAWGFFSRNVGKTFHCKNCNYRW